MKVLIVSQYFWPESFRINEVARDLNHSGHEVEILTGKPNYPEGVFYQGYGNSRPTREVWNDITIHRLPILPRGMNSKYGLVLNYLSFILSGLLLGPFMLRKKQFDVIFVYAPSPIFQVIPASFIGWLKKIPVVLWVQDLWPQSVSATGHIESKLALKILEKAVAFTYRHTNLLLAQSHAFIPHIQQLNYCKVPVKYLPNSVDDSFLLSIDNNHETANKTEYFDIVFAGNIGTAQAIETIVAAAEKLVSYPKIRFLIYGQGSKLAWLQNEVSYRNLKNLICCGQKAMHEMPELLRQASALLVTLSKQPIFALTIPSKLQAYLATGKPVIACLDGEGARIVQEAHAGITTPAENADALEEAILELYHSPKEELWQMGKNGQDYFKMHYKQDLVMRMLVSALESAIEDYKGKSV